MLLTNIHTYAYVILHNFSKCCKEMWTPNYAYGTQRGINIVNVSKARMAHQRVDYYPDHEFVMCLFNYIFDKHITFTPFGYNTRLSHHNSQQHSLLCMYVHHHP